VYNDFIFTVFPLQDITPYIHGKLNTSGLIDLIEIKGCQWLTQGLSILEMTADSEVYWYYFSLSKHGSHHARCLSQGNGFFADFSWTQ